MNDLSDRLTNLSPERRELLSLLLQKAPEAPEKNADAGPSLPRIEPDPRRRNEPFPLASMQQAQWIGRGGTFQLGNVASHVYFEFESDALDLERLARSWRRLIERHDMLRAVVRPDGQQEILREVPEYRIEVLDLRGQPPGRAATELESVRAAMSHEIRPADRWPLFAIRASRLDGLVRLHISFDLLLADAWSFLLLVKEWGTVYAEPDRPLAPLDLSFRDYVLAERRHQDLEVFRSSLEFWRQRLPSLPPPPDLPLAVSPETVREPRFRRWSVRLEEETWSRLTARAGRVGLTPSGVVLAAFAKVLATWSKNLRFSLNLTVFNRLPLHPQVEEILGEFTSFIFLEVDATAPASFEELALSLQEQLWKCLDHRHVSGVRILRELARLQGRTQGGAMPVVVTSTIGNYVADPGGSPFAWLGRLAYGITQAPQVWMDNQVWEDGGALVLDWDAVDQLFPAGLLDDMTGAYRRLLERLADDAEAWRTPNLTLVPPRQLAQRAGVNATDAPLPEETLHGLFAARAAEHPERPAVITSQRTLSYGELDRLSHRIGRLLRRRGARPDRLVAVALDKGWEQVAAVLGVLRSGAAYLPVDPKLPAERLRYLLRHGGVELALTRSGLAGSIAWPDGVEPLCVDDPAPDETDETDETGEVGAAGGPQDLAYVIYTSGSTGHPKGVAIAHRSAVNTILDVNRRFAVGAGDRVLGLSSLSFDLSVYDVFGLLAAGGAVVLPDPGTDCDPEHWLELAERHRVTVWNSVPALQEMFVEYLAGRAGRPDLPLRLLLLSGDWIPVGLPRRARQLFPAARMVSLGGATEASIWSILYPIDEVDPAWPSIPYGKPMLNQRFSVLNEALEPCPVWVTGQLCIAGAGLARGYWGDEEKTRASFVEHPRTGERLYRTGDLGRYLPDGNIELLGREDFQVKVQGFRIELGEIEAVLAEHPAVRTAVAAALGEAQGRKRLVAWVVPEAGAAPPEADELRALAAARLPEYMVPADFVLIDRLPLTANGKVDRQALPAPDRRGAGEGETAAGDGAADELARVFAEVLGVDRLGAGENFFAAGGDSILGIQVVNRAQEKGFHITPQQLFEHRTIADLAAAVRFTPRQGDDQGPVTGPVPLTPPQLRLLEREDPGDAAESLALDLLRPAAPALVERAVERLLVHHDALRLRCEREDGAWRQRGDAPGGPAPFLIVDLTALAAVAQERAFALASRPGPPFDLATGPLLRAVLFQRGGTGDDRLLLSIHPLAVDEAGWQILVEDLAAALEQAGQGREITLPAKTASSRQWAERIAGHDAAAAAAPESRPRSRRPVRMELAALSEEETRGLLERAAAAYGNTPQEVLLAGLARTLARLAGESAPRIEAEVPARQMAAADLDLARTVGCHEVGVPLALDPRGLDAPGEALKTVKERLRAVRGLPGGPPAAASLFCRLREPAAPEGSGLSPAGRSSHPAGGWRGGSPLEVSCELRGGRLRAVWQGDAERYPAGVLQGLAEGFAGELRALVAHCESAGIGYTPSDFPQADLAQDELDRFIASFGTASGG